jgi:hypothetical protein
MSILAASLTLPDQHLKESRCLYAELDLNILLFKDYDNIVLINRLLYNIN